MTRSRKAGLAAFLTTVVSVVIALATGCHDPYSAKIIVGSKNFTEQVVLAELMAQHIESRLHISVECRFYLAGSYIAHQAVLADVHVAAIDELLWPINMNIAPSPSAAARPTRAAMRTGGESVSVTRLLSAPRTRD